MRHWSLLGIRNWRAKPGRTAAALAAIALGVGVVIWVTCAYESVRLALTDQVWFWIGRSHISVESVYGSEGTVFESISKQVENLDNVKAVTYRLKHRVRMRPLKAAESAPAAPATDWLQLRSVTVQAVGIDPATEYVFRNYDEQRVAGRMIEPGDADEAVLDRNLAQELGLKVGDRIALQTLTLVSPEDSGPKAPSFTIVGLIEHRRVAAKQDPIVIVMLDRLQALVGYDGRGNDPKRVTKIDILLNDTSKKALGVARYRVLQLAEAHAQGFLVTSAESKLRQVESAERQSGFVLLLVSCVALFTAFFIILSTLSMGMVERIGQLGTLRCLGLTRVQMAILVLSEAVPLGFVGILLGVPTGLGLARLSMYLAPDYVGQFAISRDGLVLALVGGAVTTLAGALLPAMQAMRVSPLAASRPQSRPTPAVLSWLAAVLGVAMILGHSWMLNSMPANRWFEPRNTLLGVSLLYCGYALLMPALVRVVGMVAVRVVAVLLRVRHHLLADQVGKATWRSAAICCGLMVGLSMIVSLVVHSGSLAAGWDFPKDFCEAFVYVSPPVDRAKADQARHIDGIKSSCLVNEGIRCTISGHGLFRFPVSRFVAGDPDDFFKIAKLEFVEGNKDEAIAKLKKGGHILVTPEFIRTQGFVFGDEKRDTVQIKGAGFARTGAFKIAGVVTSPALDIAANYFNAGGMLVSASVYVVLGTFEDARRVFKVPDEASMFLVNFDLPETVPGHPPEFADDKPPEVNDATKLAAMVERWRGLLPERHEQIDEILKRRGELAKTAEELSWSNIPSLALFRDAMTHNVSGEWAKTSPAQRWQAYREELVMRLLAHSAGSNPEQYASVRALKQQIDGDLRRATMLFSAIPAVALIVAALGVANLMMANVASRSRQIATLRAVGATKWQVTRLVIGEALVLGTLGSAMGVALGLHAAVSMNAMTRAIWGFAPKWAIPWDLVGPGIAFTMAVCLLAGLIPARRAARNNIIDALQTT